MYNKKSSIVLTALLFSLHLHAYNDSDLDGVEDSLDRCPNTPFMDIVDLDGCTKRSLVTSASSERSPHHYDVIVGMSYSGADYNQLSRSDTATTSLQADYYYKDLSLQAAASYYYSQESDGGTATKGFYDTFLGASYGIAMTESLKLYGGLGVLLPTYETTLNNNETDYKASVSVSYTFKKINLFGGYSYTFVGDRDVVVSSISYKYQDTHSFNGGAGIYASSDLYLSLSYFESDSIYADYARIKSASLYGYYTIDKNWFTTLSYARGLSDTATDNYASLRLGYYF